MNYTCHTLSLTFLLLIGCTNPRPLETENLKVNQDNQQINITDEQSNINNEIILFMKDHEQSGVIESNKSDAQYYRVLIKKINESESLIQDFYISGSKLTDPYIATDNDNKYVYNENAGYDFYPRKGSRVVWYESGKKQADTYYEKNKESLTWLEWYENGQKKSEITYIDGKENGISKTWNQYGVLTGECSYKMGIEDGRCYAKYHNNPNVFIYDGWYENGEKVGIWRQWDIDGNLKETNINKNKKNNKYFTQDEITEISKAFNSNSCDVSNFDNQTKKYGFANTYGNPYVDGYDNIDELNEYAKCLLVQQDKMRVYNDVLDEKGAAHITKVDAQSKLITDVNFDIDYSKFTSCTSNQKESPFTITYFKNDNGKLERAITKNDYDNFDCYEKQLSEYSNKNSVKEIINSKKLVNNEFNGQYSFDISGANQLTGNGIYLTYDIELSNKSCHIDMVGYQADNHFQCYIKSINSHSIEVYKSDDDKKIGVIGQTADNKYVIDLESDSKTYQLDKVK